MPKSGMLTSQLCLSFKNTSPRILPLLQYSAWLPRLGSWITSTDGDVHVQNTLSACIRLVRKKIRMRKQGSIPQHESVSDVQSLAQLRALRRDDSSIAEVILTCSYVGHLFRTYRFTDTQLFIF